LCQIITGFTETDDFVNVKIPRKEALVKNLENEGLTSRESFSEMPL